MCLNILRRFYVSHFQITHSGLGKRGVLYGKIEILYVVAEMRERKGVAWNIIVRLDEHYNSHARVFFCAISTQQILHQTK